MDYDFYIDQIASGRLKIATEYKKMYIPDVLYKYYWLDDNDEKNEKKFKTLEEGKIYMSSLKEFNDPFEGRAFVLDKTELRNKKWDPKWFEDYIEQINSNVGIGCFCNTDEKEQNMPMWAYYSNNHSGFCAEYMTNDKVKKFMYPVSYDNTRALGNAIIGNIIDQTLNLIKEGRNENDMPDELNAQIHLAYLSLTSKHKSWKHEKEIRALLPRSYGKYLELQPRKIYIGLNCKKTHRTRIIEIAKSFQPCCEVFQMTNVANNLNHWLMEEKIEY